MIHITRTIAAAVINEFQEPFDTHMVEKSILRFYTDSFARELLEFYRRHPGGDTLKQFSAHFGKWIDREFEQQIIKTRKVSSNNLAGVLIPNQEWRRSNTTPIT